MTPWEAIVLIFTITVLGIAGVTTWEKNHYKVELPAFVKPSVFEPTIERRTFADI